MKTIRLVVFVALLSVCFSCGRDALRYRSCSGAVWSTTYSITYESNVDLADSILRVMKQVESSLSPFDSSSVISRINRGESLTADSLVKRIFTASQMINRASGGVFDPTVAPLINLWGFGYKNTAGGDPTKTQIDNALKLVGIGRCRLQGDRIIKCDSATEFNFSAITKGYGCDLIGEMLQRNGVENYMIEIGGEIALHGKNPEGDDWHIQIDAPVADRTGAHHHALSVVSLTDCGIATSGNYRNFRETAGGRRTWHTIDPLTGYPAESEILSATVVAPKCMEADALATACMAMSAERAVQMVRRIDGAKALLVLPPEDGGNDFRIVTTEEF